jgi:polar amino acid transport system substrate-binding protein
LRARPAAAARPPAAAARPQVFCDPNRPSATYSGFDVELWRRIAGPGVAVSDAFRDRGYEFRCLDSLAALLAGAAPGGGCDLAMGSITMTEERIAAGSRYSFPYYLSALGVLVKSEPATASGWGWVRPFSWQLWAALGATLLVYPLILALIEFGSLKTRVRARELGPGYFEAIIRSMWTLTGGETLEVSSAGAKLASVCFAFTALILAATYTANLASELTVSSLTSSISSVEALRGRAVLTDTIYAPRLLAHHGIAALEAPLSSAAAGRAAAEQVLSGSLAAVVNDFPYLLRASASQPGCVLRVLPWRIEEFNYAIVVSADFPEELLQKLDVAILTLQENNELEVLKERFNVLGDLCADAATETQAVQLQSVSRAAARPPAASPPPRPATAPRRAPARRPADDAPRRPPPRSSRASGSSSLAAPRPAPS